MNRRAIPFCQRWMCLLALLAVGVRMAVPAGFMPMQGAGAVALVACPEAGPVIAMPAGHHAMAHGHGTADRHDGQHCPFAAMASAADRVGVAAPFAPPFAPALVPLVLSFAAFAIGHGLAAPPPPKTGPPILLR